MLAALASLGGLLLLVGGAVAQAGRPPVQPRNYFYQLQQIGSRALGLAVAMSAFAGAVLAFQFGEGLERFGAKLYIGQTSVTGLFRELGPILTALVVGGRVAAGIAAELGGMVVSEQIDAVRALGASPLGRLVAPRLFATTLTMPLLAILADVVGVLGAMAVARLQYGIPARLFLSGVYDFVTFGDFFSGLIKSVAFGFLVGAVACQSGLAAGGGTEGVGHATTRAVVASSLAVLAADLVLTKLLLQF